MSLIPKIHKKFRVGKIEQKILLILSAGIAIGLTRSFNRQVKICKELSKEWRDINRQTLERSINRLYQTNILGIKRNADGTTTLMLNEYGKKLALSFDPNNINVKKPELWDKKWRIVIFDIPHRLRYARDALGHMLKRLGCVQIQKSVYIHPFDCEKEVKFISSWHNVGTFVRFIVAEYVENEKELRQHFRL